MQWGKHINAALLLRRPERKAKKTGRGAGGPNQKTLNNRPQPQPSKTKLKGMHWEEGS